MTFVCLTVTFYTLTAFPTNTKRRAVSLRHLTLFMTVYAIKCRLRTESLPLAELTAYAATPKTFGYSSVSKEISWPTWTGSVGCMKVLALPSNRYGTIPVALMLYMPTRSPGNTRTHCWRRFLT